MEVSLGVARITARSVHSPGTTEKMAALMVARPVAAALAGKVMTTFSSQLPAGHTGRRGRG